MLFSLPDFTFLQGTISDQTGAFNIKSNETKGVLPISSVGYSTILLPCTSSNMGTIQLYSDAQLLYSRPYYAQLRSNVMYINRYIYMRVVIHFYYLLLSHNITLGTTYKWVCLSAGYQYVKDAIISFSGAYSEDDPTIALINMINAPDYDKIFASLVLSPTMGLWSPQNKRIVCNKKLSLTAKGFNLPLWNNWTWLAPFISVLAVLPFP